MPIEFHHIHVPGLQRCIKIQKMRKFFGVYTLLNAPENKTFGWSAGICSMSSTWCWKVMGYTLWAWLMAVLVSIIVYCAVTPPPGRNDTCHTFQGTCPNGLGKWSDMIQHTAYSSHLLSVFVSFLPLSQKDQKERRDHECSEAIWMWGTLCSVMLYSSVSPTHGLQQTARKSKRNVREWCSPGSGRSVACSPYSNIQYTCCKLMWIVHMWVCVHMSAVYTADLPSPQQPLGLMNPVWLSERALNPCHNMMQWCINGSCNFRNLRWTSSSSDMKVFHTGFARENCLAWFERHRIRQSLSSPQVEKSGMTRNE